MMVHMTDTYLTILTGASRGMGESHAREFVRQGAKVVMTDMNVKAGQAIADELGENALFVAQDGSEISVEWQTWSRVLGLPGLVVNADGTLRDPLGPLGRVQGNVKSPRKRGRVIGRDRRSARRLRRKTGIGKLDAMIVRRGEHEIIARN